MKLKSKRDRSVYEVIDEVRGKVKAQEPELDVDFTQVLQDMIGDLTGAPQPVVVKLFSPDADLLATWAPKVADALGRSDRRRQETGGGYRRRHRQFNQRAGSHI